MSDRLTLATASGLPLLSLVFHVAMGVAALVAGYIAIAARKGGTWHRRSGTVFVYAMIAMALTAIGIALYKGSGDIGAGGLTVYLIFTAWTTVKPLPAGRRQVDVALMLVAFLFAATGYAKGFAALDRPGNHIDGVPAGMIFFMNTIVLLAAIGDARMIFAGGIQGTRRLERHLWRMCFGLFIASGSFVAQLAMMKGMPVWMRSVPVMVLLGSAPLVVLLYWMWRVRLRQNLRGLMTSRDLRISAPSALH